MVLGISSRDCRDRNDPERAGWVQAGRGAVVDPSTGPTSVLADAWQDGGMAVLVDEAIWPWRGRRWAHLVSDSHIDELHDLAHRIGMPYLAFQGDHYDIHEELRIAAIEEGAQPTPARDLVRALRAAGLRRRGPVPSWQWRERLRIPVSVIPSDTERWLIEQLPNTDETAAKARDYFLESVLSLDEFDEFDELGTAERPGERLIVVSTARSQKLVAGMGFSSPAASLHRSSGERGTYIELVLRDQGFELGQTGPGQTGPNRP